MPLVVPDDFLTIVPPEQQMALIEAAHPRSSHWAAFCKDMIKKTPYCGFCGEEGGSTQLIGHHIIPYHISPSLELEESNVFVVGQTCTTGQHHLFGCHFGNYSKWNPDVKELAAVFLANRRRILTGYEPIRIFN